MRDGITVVKVGGNEVDDAGWVRSLARALASLRGPVVLVHGGGKEVSDLQRTLGAEPSWRGGLRITTPEALKAVQMVLSGVVNKRLVAALLDEGLDAVGVSGEDGGLLVARPCEGGAIGRTGEVTEVRPRVLRTLLSGGMTPVVSPVSRGTDGGALNVNADEAAGAVASALGARRLLLVTNVPGVMRADTLLGEVEGEDVEELIGGGVANGGMAPKLRSAARAAEAGVPDVRIGGLELLDVVGAGTRVTARVPYLVAL